ncbi:MAG TPA: hypothetical protein VF517_04710 [Thermoleophilaceae bacterium]|jgi:hypothetical protein
MESDFDRATRAASANEMPPPFRAALDEHAALVGIEGPVLSTARAAAVTESTPHRRRLLRRQRPHVTWMVVCADVLAVVGDASGAPVGSLYRLAELEAKPFSSPLVQDEGLEATALPVGGSERVSVFLPLAPGPPRDAIAAALALA